MVGVFLVPIILIILPVMQSLGLSGNSGASQVDPIFSAIIFLLPGTFNAMLFGEILIGEEGQSVWRIYSSPISAKNLVRSKYFFMSFFSIIIVLISGALGIFLYRTAWTISIAIFLESLLLVMAVGAVALSIGFKGPDFSQSRRTRMVRQEWSLIGLVVCSIVGLAVLAPLIFSVGLALLFGGAIVQSNLAISIVVSAAISLTICIVIYRINIGLAEEFLRKAEV
jgi:hypothetical protein